MLGPGGKGTAATTGFTPVAMPRCIGHDPLWQFIHEDDVVDLLIAMAKQKPTGVFNAAGEGTIPYSEIASALGKICLPLPDFLIKATTALTWSLRLQSRSPASGLQFMKYPVILGTEKLEKEVGFKCRYSSREALRAYVDGK